MKTNHPDGSSLDTEQDEDEFDKKETSTLGNEKEGGDASEAASASASFLPRPRRTRRHRHEHGQNKNDEQTQTASTSSKSFALASHDNDRDADKSLRFYFVAEEVLARRAAEWRQRGTKCDACFHDKPHCVCRRLTALVQASLQRRRRSNNNRIHNHYHQHHHNKIRIVLYMHYLEYGNAGNSGKLLLECLPPHGVSTQLLMYGRRENDVQLKALIPQQSHQPHGTAVLFPSEYAVSVREFWKACCEEEDNDHSTPATTSSSSSPPPRMTLIVLDATYSKAKRMLQHLNKRIYCTNSSNSAPSSSSPSHHDNNNDTPHRSIGIPTVQLQDATPSVFARGRGTYAQQAPAGRVSTAEAVVRALQECCYCNDNDRDDADNDSPIHVIAETVLAAIRLNNASYDPGQVRQH